VDDQLPYNAVLFAGTHNSAINLGAHTVGRPSGARGGNYPSEAHSAYQYIVMDQRLSIRDQLDQGIRVIDLEVAAITGTTWDCNSSQTDQLCNEVVHLSGRCFTDCPFLISHGSVQQSVGELMGYTYPETVFTSIAEWVKQPQNAEEIITILMIATHGNPQPTTAAVLDRMNATGLLPHVWNPTEQFTHFPTLGEMRSAGRTVMIATGYGWGWGPSFVGSSTDSTGIEGAGDTMEGWDSITFDQLAPDRARLRGDPSFNGSVMVIENLSSRRGRSASSAKYWPLPNELADFPFQAGGNPAQAVLAANYTHVLALETEWAALLKPFGVQPNWVLVDFFNTSTPVRGAPSRTLLPNEDDGLVRAVRDINIERRKKLLDL